MSGTRKFQDWERVLDKDGRTGVIGNYDYELRQYVVLWDDNGWDYADVTELRKADST
jgi:hypothetical protein